MIGDIRHIIVIESLKATEKQTGKELYNDIIKMQIDYVQPVEIKMSHKFFDTQTKNEFIEILKYLVYNSKYMQGGVLIHLEMHGSSGLDGLVFADNSFIDWVELVDLFREININLCDKLFITMATCYGRYLYKGGNARLKSPFSGYISASKEVTVSEIMDDFTIVFDDLIKYGNIIESYLKLDALGTTNFFYKDSKGVFEDSFNSILEKIRNDSTIKADILKKAIKESQLAGEPIAGKEMEDFIFNKALKDLYILHKSAYEFNC